MLTDQQLSATFAALADPTRRRIVERLALGDAYVGELARPLPLSLPTVSRHIKALVDARIVVRERQARNYRCRLNGAALGEAADWIARHRAFWEARLDALAAYLEPDAKAEPQRRGRGARRPDNSKGDRR
jgi:DNA-binding transcriptional ArsR family regulator